MRMGGWGDMEDSKRSMSKKRSMAKQTNKLQSIQNTPRSTEKQELPSPTRTSSTACLQASPSWEPWISRTIVHRA